MTKLEEAKRVFDRAGIKYIDSFTHRNLLIGDYFYAVSTGEWFAYGYEPVGTGGPHAFVEWYKERHAEAAKEGE